MDCSGLRHVIASSCDSFNGLRAAASLENKKRLWQQIKDTDGEGVVFKRIDSPVTSGRPNSGGDWRKFKFTETASCCVMELNNDKRSVRIGLLNEEISDATPDHLVMAGNVTIPPNHTVPSIGDIVEVEYLYAYPGGSLYQPVYRGQRNDLELNDCTFSQLKYKPVDSK